MTPQMAIANLMMRDKIPAHWRVQPEERICIEFADTMRRYVLTGLYSGLWMHLANEGKRHPVTAIVMKAMGMLTGAPDYVFMWEGGNAVIEFKVGKTKQTPFQEFFQIWADDSKVTYALCRTADQAVDLLRELGAFEKKKIYVEHKKSINSVADTINGTST